MKKKIVQCAVAIIGILCLSFTNKHKPYKILQDKNMLVYAMNYDKEDYKYEVKTTYAKSQITFDYKVNGGSKILSGVYNAPDNSDYNYKESKFTIPGSLVEGNFEPYFLISKVNFNKLKSLKWSEEAEIAMNDKNYTISASGEDDFSFTNKENDEYVRAMYFTFVEGSKNGTLILGTGLNKQIILELSLEGSYRMKLESIN